MTERSEELGLAGRLPIVVGGQPVDLRTLNLDESDEWQKQFAAFDVAFDSAEEAKRTTDAMLELVIAYDVDSRLGPDVRKRFTRAELYAAFKQMAQAEIPFLADSPSAARVFGETLAARLVVGQFPQESSTSSPSPNGDSTPALSVVGSARNSSSSSGRTARSASSGRARKR